MSMQEAQDILATTYSCFEDPPYSYTHTPLITKQHSLPTPHISSFFSQSAKMVQENDVVAIIIIILFFLLALIAFGIYRLVNAARDGGSETESESTSRLDDD